MDTYGDLDARLEHKKRVKLRRQQRELKTQKRQLDAQEKERFKLVLRCAEMAREDALSVAMMRFYRYQERLHKREIQRENDMHVYAETAAVRRKAQTLGLSLETRCASGQDRLHALRRRVQVKEAALATAHQAKQQLDALPAKRSRARKLLASFFSSSTRAKLERAVLVSRCEAIVALLDGKKCLLLNHESQNGLTPVLCAIYQHKHTLLRRLLELGASPDYETQADGMTPLLACVRVDSVVALHLLVEFHVHLKYETQEGVTALLLAADKGRNNIAKSLLRLGVGVDDANRDGRTPLMQAVLSGHYETTKILLAFNANKFAVDTIGRSALVLARQWKWDSIASLLSADTASTTLRSMIQEQDDRERDAPNRLVQYAIKNQSKPPGRIAMETALRDGNVDRILDLLSVDDAAYGPNMETETGATPLLVVSAKGTRDDVLYCLERRCIVTHCNREGVTALMKAAYHGNHEVLELLIRAGCSLWSRDIRGHDAVRYLHDNEHHDLVSSLTKANQPVTRPRFQLGHMLEVVGALRSPVASTPHEASASDCQRQDEGNDESDSGRQESDHGSDKGSHRLEADDVETASEWTKCHKWTIRRRVLRRAPGRNASFEAERRKILKNGERGRRHGLIAPLPHDTAGRFKFPPCDNCHGNRARKRCFLCDQVLCDPCHARLHELPHRRHHEYEELAPTRMVGMRPLEHVVANQEASLQGTLKRSLLCVDAIKLSLLSAPAPGTVPAPAADLEVEIYQRKQRAIHEKEIASAQINVPVSAARHAMQAGEAAMYTNPTEIELADLFITQGKWTKARALMDAVRQTTEDAFGPFHPTMLTIHLRLARIAQQNGDLDRSISVIRFALGAFESVVAADSKDLAAVQELGLHVLDTLADYAAAVELCRRIHRQRVVILSKCHTLVQQAQRDLDAIIAKREMVDMRNEDLLALQQATMSADQAEQFRLAKERKSAAFYSLLLEQQPPERYVSFVAFAKKEFADDMVQFWIAVETAKTKIDAHDARAFRAAVVVVFITYIKPRRIKIITAVQRKKMKKMITTPGKTIPRTIFDDVQVLVFDVIYHRVYGRFEETDAAA